MLSIVFFPRGGRSSSKPTVWDGDCKLAESRMWPFQGSKPTVWDGDLVGFVGFAVFVPWLHLLLVLSPPCGMETLFCICSSYSIH
jgi:hypothetical protein